ncbi:MAG TPA: HtaA domain-containing protein [Solirubrobacterales bacterium]|jgi:Htaa|nr:HtaA domain-containing protein [Solirubrobacterales bacterium]
MTTIQRRARAPRHRLTALAVLGAAASVAALALAGPATAAKLGGKTLLAPKAATFDALAAEGVTVAPAGNAEVTGKGIAFPITRGKLNVERVSGKLKHSGGLTFSDHGTSLTLQNFVIKVGAKDVIRADVAGGGKVRLADLDLDKARISERGDRVVISKVKALLAGKAARALSATFGLPDLAGANLGKAKVKVKP